MYIKYLIQSSYCYSSFVFLAAGTSWHIAADIYNNSWHSSHEYAGKFSFTYFFWESVWCTLACWDKWWIWEVYNQEMLHQLVGKTTLGETMIFVRNFTCFQEILKKKQSKQVLGWSKQMFILYVQAKQNYMSRWLLVGVVWWWFLVCVSLPVWLW